jgi:hypothetical protein
MRSDWRDKKQLELRAAGTRRRLDLAARMAGHSGRPEIDPADGETVYCMD